jgi:hypothetical protein
MSLKPLFSTYRQGENRVTASLLAVLSRLGTDLTERVLGALLDEPDPRRAHTARPGGRRSSALARRASPSPDPPTPRSRSGRPAPASAAAGLRGPG